MTKTEILATLAEDYLRTETVYNSMEKQAQMLLEQGKASDSRDMSNKAQFRTGTLYGIQRAAEALGISKTDFMEAVEKLRPE